MLFTYVTRELRRRYRQTLLISVGLAVAIGLVITVTAASAGVGAAQADVLHALYGVGTDITVSKAATAGSGGPTRVSFQPPSQSQAGRTFNRDVLTTGAQGTLDATSATAIAKMAHVASVSSSLELTELHIQGTFSSGAAPTVNGSGSSSTRPSGGGSGGRPPINLNTTSIDGIAIDRSGLGPINSSEISSGRYFDAADATADNAIITTSYARQQSLKLGSSVTIKGTSFKVVGLVSAPAGSDVSIYIPLQVAQNLAGMSGKVTQIYVQASSATEISAVQSEIQKAVSGATVDTSSELASEITGSLSNASTIITKLGLWLSVAVLVVAFGMAILLTTSAVSRRVREFGTLKALGWPVRRIVGQVMAESLVQGVIGGIVGIALGFGGAALITHFAPTLTAAIPTGGFAGGGFPRGGSGTGSGGFPRPGSGTGGFPGGAFRNPLAGHTIPIHLTAQVQTEAIILAVCLAIAGGLIAGLFGGWRAARLRPAVALRSVE